MKKEKKNYVGSEALPASLKEESKHHQRKQKKSVGIRGMTSSTPFLVFIKS